MIPRAEIEFTLAMAEKGVRAECPPEVMAELCRVYLAWVDAPELEISEAFLSRGDDESTFLLITACGNSPSDGDLVEGKRVRLVVVDE